MFPAINTKHEKKWLFYYYPVVTGMQKVGYTAEWFDMWSDLRTKGRDEFAYLLKVLPARKISVKLRFDKEIFGTLDWDRSNPKYKGVSVSKMGEGSEQTLSIEMSNPDTGREYRFGFHRVTH